MSMELIPSPTSRWCQSDDVIPAGASLEQLEEEDGDAGHVAEHQGEESRPAGGPLPKYAEEEHRGDGRRDIGDEVG